MGLYSWGSLRLGIDAISANRELSGSVVECLTQDQVAPGSNLTSDAALCP